MNNLYNAIVLFLVITSTGLLVSCTDHDSNNDQEIFMVVDDNPSTIPSQIKADNRPVQTGRFKLEDGKSLTLLRASNGKENCVQVNRPCGALDWCCDPLHCDGFINGTCRPADYCLPRGSACSQIRVPCCKGLVCDGLVNGKCEREDYCLPANIPCENSIFPCCSPNFCRNVGSFQIPLYMCA